MKPQIAARGGCSSLPACRRAAEELARALLPYISVRTRAATQVLEGLAERVNASQELSAAEIALLEDLERDPTATRGTGFLLGVIAAASGVDLFVARRERSGLREAVRMVCEAQACVAEPALDTLPLVSCRLGSGWEIPFLGAYVFWRGAALGRSSARVRWHLEHEPGFLGLSVHRPEPLPELDRSLEELAPIVSGAEVLRGKERFGFRIPAAWFEMGAEPG